MSLAKETELILGPNKTKWAIQNYFPEANKVAVLFSGGIDSTLIANISIDLYGKDNVSLIWSDAMFCNDDPDVKQTIKLNVETVAKMLGIEPFYVPVDYEYFKIDPLLAQRNAWMEAQSVLGFDHMFMGMTGMFWDIIPLQNMSRQEIIDYCNSDRNRYKVLIEQWHIDTDTYTEHLKMNIHPNVVNWLKDNVGKQFCFPLGALHKDEIIDLYFKLGKQDLLYKTISCTLASGEHCGECWNCQNRFDGHDINELTDLTVYKSNLIKERRALLK